MTNRRALITGGTGYVGSRLVRRLRADDWSVHLLVRRHSVLGELEDLMSITRVANDDSTSAAVEAVRNAIVEAQPDVVISLATHRPHSTDHETAPMFDANARLPALLLAELAANGGGRWIGSSSFMHRPLESPPTLYAATHAALEPTVRWAQSHGNVTCTTLSLTSVYGPGDPRDKLLGRLLHAARTGTPIDLVRPSRVMDLVHVDDVARAYAHAAELQMQQDAIEDRYDVCTGTGTSIAALVRHVERATGLSIDANWDRRTSGPADAIDPPTRPRWLPEWQPEIDISTGIRSVANARMR